MRPTIVVYIATSIDGFISRTNGSLDWLAPAEDAAAYQRFETFLSTVMAVVMGRNTFQLVLSFDQWPYQEIPAYVLSRTLSRLPENSPRTVRLRNCSPEDLIAELGSQKFQRVYIDGGETVKGFLVKDLIDELTITRLPIILGSGRTLFGAVPFDLHYQHVSTQTFSTGAVQSKYVRVRH